MANGYLYPGRVVKLDPNSGGPIVQIPLLGGDVLWGPFDDSCVPDLKVGDRVICASLGASANTVQIIGRTPGSYPTVDQIAGLPATLDAIGTRLDAVELDNNTDQLVLDGHETRIAATEVKNTQQDGRLTAVEGVNTTQNNRLTATETVANAAAPASTLATLRADTAGQATTKGDLLAATGAGVLTRQPVGATGLALVADPAQASGLAYAERRGVPLGLTGATSPTRYVGATAAGAPTTGTFAVGDFVIAGSGDIFVCTAAGTPGTWKRLIGDGPRGVVARSRRNTNTLGINNTASTKISEVAVAVLPGRSYEVRTRCGIYVDGNGNGIVDYHVRYTTNGTATTATSALLEHVGVFCPPGGYVMACTTEETYVPASAVTLTIGIYARVAVGTTGGIYSSLTDEWRPRIVIEDKGVDPGVTGTQF